MDMDLYTEVLRIRYSLGRMEECLNAMAQTLERMEAKMDGAEKSQDEQ